MPRIKKATDANGVVFYPITISKGVWDIDNNKRLSEVIAGKSEKSATVSDVSYNTTSKKITKTINGSTTDVATAAEIVTDGGGITSHQTVTDNNPTLVWGTKSKVATIGSTDINVTMPANPNTNTTYKLTLNGTDTGGGTTSLGTVYAPSTAGTSGQYLASSGSGAPTWTNFPTIPSKMSDVAVMSVSAISSDTSSLCSITGAGNAGKSETIIYTNSGSSDLTVTVPTTYATPENKAIELTCVAGGYCEVNYLNIGGTIYARGL